MEYKTLAIIYVVINTVFLIYAFFRDGQLMKLRKNE